MFILSYIYSAFIIAPWAQDRDSTIGGMRMDKLGNTEFHGSVRSTKITVDATWWSDFVFADDYKLRPLSEVESFIIVNKHLPDMPNENELIDDGIDFVYYPTSKTNGSDKV